MVVHRKMLWLAGSLGGSSKVSEKSKIIYIIDHNISNNFNEGHYVKKKLVYTPNAWKQNLGFKNKKSTNNSSISSVCRRFFVEIKLSLSESRQFSPKMIVFFTVSEKPKTTLFSPIFCKKKNDDIHMILLYKMDKKNGSFIMKTKHRFRQNSNDIKTKNDILHFIGCLHGENGFSGEIHGNPATFSLV